MCRLPTVAEYMKALKDIEPTSADTYRYLNFDRVPTFVDKASKVELSPEMRAAAKQLRARGALTSSTNSTNSSSSSKDGGSPAPIAIQTSRNTVDVRGRQADEAANEVQSAVLSAPSGWALFVVHGVGTGRVRAEVLSMLRRSPRVAKLEEAEASNGGCTVVHIK